MLRRLVEEYRAECVIDLVWQACLTYDVETWRVKRLAETELNIPYLRIETDYSPSDSARIALPPQVHVLAAIIMLVAITIIVISSTRRSKNSVEA